MRQNYIECCYLYTLPCMVLLLFSHITFKHQHYIRSAEMKSLSNESRVMIAVGLTVRNSRQQNFMSCLGNAKSPKSKQICTKYNFVLISRLYVYLNNTEYSSMDLDAQITTNICKASHKSTIRQ